MATINWTLGPARKDGTIPVVIKISLHNQRKKFFSGIVVTPGEYGKVAGTVKVKSKTRMRKILNKVNECQQKAFDYETEHYDVTVQDILDVLTGKKMEGGLDFFDFADEYLATSEIKGKKNYTTMLNSLSRFLGRRFLPFRDITYRLLSDYMLSLKDKPRAQSLYLGAIRHLHRQARLQYNTESSTVITGDVFDRFKVPRQKPKGQRAIDIDTLRKVIAYTGTGRAGLARDCFVLSFLLMGMNSADMYDTDAVIKDGKLCYHRKKTRDRRADGAYIEITIPAEAKPLFKKYKGRHAVFSFRDRYSTETEFNRGLNKGLKKVSEDLGIEKLQFYAARHTWASIAYNDCSIDKGVVNDALIHIDKDMSVTDLYIKKDYTRVNDANRKVIDHVYGKKQKPKQDTSTGLPHPEDKQTPRS